MRVVSVTSSVRTVKEIYDASLARTSFTLVMLGIAGGMALLLGVAGIYGVGWGYRPVAWGPRPVCRWRPSPWGPRQVCWRGW